MRLPFSSAETGLVLLRITHEAVDEINHWWGNTETYYKPKGDHGIELFTKADLEAQALIIRRLRQHFPGYGVIAEEGKLRLECTLGGTAAYFTIDPLDGTSAFKRAQPFGVAVQIAMVVDGRVEAVVINDVNSGDVYWYEPEDKGVYRARDYWKIDLAVDAQVVQRRGKPIQQQVALLWKPPERLVSPLLRKLVKPKDFGGVFLDYHVGSGSVGLRAARLFTADVGAHVIQPHYNTPWDNAPLVGMSERLGIVWLRPTADDAALEQFQPALPAEPVWCPHDTIMVHESKVEELQQAAAQLA